MQKLQKRQPVTLFILSFFESPCIGDEVRGGIGLSFFYFHRIVSLCTSNNNPDVITTEKQSLASVILLYLRFIAQGAPGKRGNPGILGEPGEKVRGC